MFDDVHWAEPTFLELVEHLADKGEGPISVVCLAREELLEERASFLDGRANVDRIVLDALSAEEADALLEGLGGATLESDQRARIAEAAEGNPLFLEQLLALALEGGLAERPLPETIQALLAARLDRLGPGERAVLERGAVVGKEFTADGCRRAARSGGGADRGCAPADARRARVRPATRRRACSASGTCSCRRRSTAPRRSAFARSCTSGTPTGSTRSRRISRSSTSSSATTSSRRIGCGRSSGESDRRTEGLAEDAGRRLGEAGVRALKRGDMSATVSLLGSRDRLLLPRWRRVRHELMCELGIAQYSAGDTDGGAAAFVDAIAGAEELGSDVSSFVRGSSARTCVSLPSLRAPQRDLLAVAERPCPRSRRSRTIDPSPGHGC